MKPFLTHSLTELHTDVVSWVSLYYAVTELKYGAWFLLSVSSLALSWSEVAMRVDSHIDTSSDVTAGRAYFFFGRTFELVAGRQRICACTVPHPLCTLTLRRAFWLWLSKTTARKTAVVKATSQVISNKNELQPITTMCIQWTVDKTGKYLATVQFVVTSKNNFHDNASYSLF